MLGREALLEAPQMLRVLAAAASAAAQGGVALGLLRKFPLPVPLAAPETALGRMAASSSPGREVCELLQGARCCSWLRQQKQQLQAAWLVVGAHHHHLQSSHQVSRSRLRAEEMGP